MSWKMRVDDRDALVAAAAEEGMTVSELVRELVDVAGNVPAGARPPADRVFLSARLPQELLDILAHVTLDTGVDASMWLNLITSPAGDILLEQLLIARKARRRWKP